MRSSHPTVHPVEAPPPQPTTDAPAGAPPRRVRMRDIQGMPGTAGGLALRCLQSVFALVALCVMTSTSDFPSVTAFRYMVAAVALQFLWSFSLAIVDTYALLVRRCLRKYRVVCLFTIGDGAPFTLLEFAETSILIPRLQLCLHLLQLLHLPASLYS